MLSRQSFEFGSLGKACFPFNNKFRKALSRHCISGPLSEPNFHTAVHSGSDWQESQCKLCRYLQVRGLQCNLHGKAREVSDALESSKGQFCLSTSMDQRTCVLATFFWLYLFPDDTNELTGDTARSKGNDRVLMKMHFRALLETLLSYTTTPSFRGPTPS